MATLPDPSKALFARYTKLPTEIRLKVLRYAFPDGRIVQLRRGSSPITRDYTIPFMTRHDFSIIPICQTPAVLQVNREAREEALRFNKLCFPSTNPVALNEEEVYFSRLDILYLSSNCFHVDGPLFLDLGVEQRMIDSVTISLSTLAASLPRDQLDGIHNLTLDVLCGRSLVIIR